MCPLRALDQALLEDAARRLFLIGTKRSLLLVPAPTLAKTEVRKRLIDSVNAGNAGVVFLQDKLGGEISLSATERSPELAFDTTLAEILPQSGTVAVGRYGILEVQTMDFHGSYKHAVNNLKDALRLHPDEFPRVLQENQAWLSDRIEGPNIANVFKRTFYQMMLKFQIAAHESCAGCILAIPESVWDSWQRHLGKPQLQARSDRTFALTRPGAAPPSGRIPAWIYVFDIGAGTATSPNPIRTRKVIATDAESISYYALRVAPEAAVAAGGSADRLLTTIRRRLITWWPELGKS